MLETVVVPEALSPIFTRAEEVVSRYFADRRDEPAKGTVEIAGERYVLIRAASLSVEFFTLARDLFGAGREVEADTFGRNVLFDLAHAIGKSDARMFHEKMGLTDPIARLSAGPVLFAHAGWARVAILPESKPTHDDEFLLVYEHPYSFEADAWLASGIGRSAGCIMNAGYSSGWTQESFGRQLVAVEILCRARGDEACRFLMSPPQRMPDHLTRYGAAHDLVVATGAAQIPDFFSRKRAEDRLRERQDELEQRVAERTAELRAANERLRAEMVERERVAKKLRQSHKLEAIGRLAGGIAHDFNNLMGVVIGRSSMLTRRLASDDAARADLDVITSAGMQAAALTQQLLAFARGQVLRRETIDLSWIVQNLARIVRPLVGEDVELSIALGEDAGFVAADRGQIEQVIMNLVVNARDAMPGGGALRIETGAAVISDRPAADAPDLPPGNYATLSVTDTGVGMDEETLAQIFDPFFTTKAEGKGTGLGLSTVYGIARQTGGAVVASSTLGRGSTFTVYLPRDESAPSAFQQAMEPEAQAPARDTILLVEDQLELRRVVQEILSEAGYQVLSAASGAEALAIAEEHDGPIHLLLTDVVMPRQRGPEVAMRVRELRAEVRVMFMSGYVDAADAVEAAARLGGHPLLEKPFSADDLLTRVRAVLAAAAPGD
jgi:signal transduction histidine kinase/ActR/RegA family two-component response regulator